jgi:hypothetical protein
MWKIYTHREKDDRAMNDFMTLKSGRAVKMTVLVFAILASYTVPRSCLSLENNGFKLYPSLYLQT